MARENINAREELVNYKLEFGVLERKPCTEQENKVYVNILKNGGRLPVNTFQYEALDGEPSAQFYSIAESGLTEAEIQEYLTYKNLKYIKTIKNCVVFFTALTILGMVGAFFLLALGIIV